MLNQMCRIGILVIFLCCSANSFAQHVKLTEVEWHGTGCFKIEMSMGTVYFEKENGVSGFKSFVDLEGNDWIASYLEPGPKGSYRGFPNSVDNFGHAGRNSGSTTTIVDGKTEGELVILESSNEKFTFQYWFFADRIAIKVLKSEGDFNFLFEGIAGGEADAGDFFVTPDGKRHIPTEEGEFDDFTPEWFYLGDPKAKQFLFLAKTPDDNAPNENHRQILDGGVHNMDLYSFGRTGKEHNYQVKGMSGNEHICIIGFVSSRRTHNEITAMIESFLAEPFTSGVRARRIWSSSVLRHEDAWFASEDARTMAESVIQYQSSQGGWPKSTDLARPPLTPGDIPPEGGGRANSLDNDATTVPMEFLARVIYASNEDSYIHSFNRGLDYLFNAQYPSGGWPQFWPLRGDKYYSRIAFNDGAMIRVMTLLRDVASGEEPYTFVDEERRSKAAAAVELGIDCILKSQIRQDGKLTAWCAQHDEHTLEPAWARAYEPPSLSGEESVGIVQFLMSVQDPAPEIIEAIQAAVIWLREVAMKGVRLDGIRNPDGRTERFLVDDPDASPLWARFYELGTNRPLYLDRDSKFRYDFSEIGYERRSGYGYHGDWPAELLNIEYHQWLERYFPSQIIEAESGSFQGSVKNSHAGFSGEGYVDTDNHTGIYLEVEIESAKAGTHLLGIRYAHGKLDVRPAELRVNGAIVRENINFMPTGTWTDWTRISFPVELKEGPNIIRLTSTWVKGLVNIDNFKVTPDFPLDDVYTSTKKKCMLIGAAPCAENEEYDKFIIAQLESWGYVVHKHLAGNLPTYTEADYAPYDFMFLSETTSSAEMPPLKEIPLPMLNSDGWGAKSSALAFCSGNQVEIYEPAVPVVFLDGAKDHPLGAGYTPGTVVDLGEVLVRKDPCLIVWAKPSIPVYPIAGIESDPERLIVYGIEKGTTNASGQIIRNRVAVVGVHAWGYDVLTEAGVKVMKAGIEWVMGEN
jgi:PelA/Pel-15E family pectate lyase